MTWIMRDSTIPSLIPADTFVVAGYGDGRYVWSSADWARFPASIKLSIVVDPTHAGDILDIERFNASPSDVPGWIDRFNRPGRRLPTIYCDRSTIDTVRTAAAGRPFDWWAATLDGTIDVPGAVAVQYVDTGSYDESKILDLGWVLRRTSMIILASSTNLWYLVSGPLVIQIPPDGLTAPALQSAGVPVAGVPDEFVQSMLKASAAFQASPTAGGLTADQAKQLADTDAGVQRLEAALKQA